MARGQVSVRTSRFLGASLLRCAYCGAPYVHRSISKADGTTESVYMAQGHTEKCRRPFAESFSQKFIDHLLHLSYYLSDVGDFGLPNEMSERYPYQPLNQLPSIYFYARADIQSRRIILTENSASHSTNFSAKVYQDRIEIRMEGKVMSLIEFDFKYSKDYIRLIVSYLLKISRKEYIHRLLTGEIVYDGKMHCKLKNWGANDVISKKSSWLPLDRFLELCDKYERQYVFDDHINIFEWNPLKDDDIDTDDYWT